MYLFPDFVTHMFILFKSYVLFFLFFSFFEMESGSVAQAHCNLCLQGSSSSPASAPTPVAGITGMPHHARLILVSFQRWGFTMLTRLVWNS